MPTQIEARLSAVEKELARLRAAVEQTGTPWWEQISGTFANDPIYEEAMRLGRKWRESQRPKSAKKGTKRNGRTRHRSRQPA